MKFTARALLAVGLLVGFYVFAAAVVVAIVLGVYEIATHGGSGAVVGKLVLVGVVVIVAIVRGLFARRSTDDAPLPGIVVPERLQPRLWAEAREIAALARTREPDEIRVVADVNAAVSEESGWLGLRPGTRRLYVGIPLMVGLEHQQLRAVLAHEFGHYSGRHTALAGVTYRGQEAIGRVITRLGTDSWTGKLFGLYARLYVAASRGVNRRQELEADLLGAELVGPRTTAAALDQLAPIQVAWAHFLEEYVGPGAELGSRPSDLFERFADFYADPATQEQLASARAEAAAEPVADRSSSRYDSHPPTHVRVARLLEHAARLQRPEPATGGPALELLRDPGPLLVALQDAVFVDGLSARPLAEVVPAAALQETGRAARRLREALVRADQPSDLGTVLDLLATGRAVDVVRPLAPAADEAGLRRGAALLTADLVAQRLVDQGRAHFTLAWPYHRTLASSDGTPLDPWAAAIASVSDPEQATALADWVAAHDVPLGADDDALDPPPPHDPVVAGPGHVLAIATPVLGRRVRTVYVLQGGIALESISFWESAKLAGRSIGRSQSRAMLRRALDRDPALLVPDRRTTWVPWSALESVRWRRKALGRGRLTLSLVDGTSRTVRFVLETEREGDVIGAIHHFVGERLTAR